MNKNETMTNLRSLLFILIIFQLIPSSTSFLHTKLPRKHPYTKIKLSSINNDDLTPAEISRYSRHLVLSDVGMLGQKRLKSSSVLVIGAGGLGSPCLLYLAAAGVGHIGIVDGDTVSESNLQRQIIHSTSTLDLPKTESALQTLRQINPHTTISLYEEELTSQNALKIFEDQKWDVVIDGSDNFPTKYLINDACRLASLPWIYSAILRFEGQLSVFNFPPGIGPDYRDFMPEPPNPENVPSCAEGGVIGVLPGVMGTLQATECIKMILKKGDICSGRVLVYDALEMQFESRGLKKLEERDEIRELIDYQGFCKSGGGGGEKSVLPASTAKEDGRTMDEAESFDEEMTFRSISPKECLDKLSQGWTPYVLDVRLETEHDIVALPFTDQVVPHREVERHHIPKEGEILVYCKAGVRGKKACKRLIELGIDADRLHNLEGGIMGWRKDVDESMPAY